MSQNDQISLVHLEILGDRNSGIIFRIYKLRFGISIDMNIRHP